MTFSLICFCHIDPIYNVNPKIHKPWSDFPLKINQYNFQVFRKQCLLISWQTRFLNKWLLSWVKCLHYMLRIFLIKHFLENTICEQIGSCFTPGRQFSPASEYFPHFTFPQRKGAGCRHEYEVDAKLPLQNNLLWWFSLLPASLTLLNLTTVSSLSMFSLSPENTFSH